MNGEDHGLLTGGEESVFEGLTVAGEGLGEETVDLSVEDVVLGVFEQEQQGHVE